MSPSYQKLIADHDAIQQAARVLVEDLARYRQSDAAKAAASVARIAAMVERHIEQEDAVMATLEGRTDAAAWGSSWEAVRSSFEDLRSRWVTFIEHWNAHRIGENWAEFRLSARAVLARLQDQVERETELFYSAALRVGAVRLRSR